MYQFFEIMREKGITAAKMSECMGISTAMFSRYRTGETRMTAEFIAKAHAALRDLGIRKRGGEEYTIEELFFSSVAVA